MTSFGEPDIPLAIMSSEDYLFAVALDREGRVYISLGAGVKLSVQETVGALRAIADKLEKEKG